VVDISIVDGIPSCHPDMAPDAFLDAIGKCVAYSNQKTCG